MRKLIGVSFFAIIALVFAVSNILERYNSVESSPNEVFVLEYNEPFLGDRMVNHPPGKMPRTVYTIPASKEEE